MPLENYITDDARNLIAQKALEGSYDFVFMMDDDMIFPHACLVRLLNTLVNQRKGCDVPTVVGGMYNRRGGDYAVVCYNFNAKNHSFEPVKVAPNSGVVKCDMVGTGCILMDTAVFTKIDYPWFQYAFWPTANSQNDTLEMFLKYDLLLKLRDATDPVKPQLSINGYKIKTKSCFLGFTDRKSVLNQISEIEGLLKKFDKTPNHGIGRWGEDNCFFKKCKDAGIPVYLDSDIVCGHLTRAIIQQKDRDNFMVISTAGHEL